MRKIKAGIIGTGFIGPLHIEALRRLGFVEIAAVADMNRQLAEEKAGQLHIPGAYGDYRELLADETIESVHICTPNHLHYGMTRDALMAGKHVICEKPLAMNLEESRELAAMASEKGLVNAVHFNIRYYPLIQHIRTLVEKGELGRILAVNGSYQQDWLFYETDYNWRLRPEYSGESRAVADIGSHWLDSVEYITGLRISRVCADLATFHPVRRKPLKQVETYAGKLQDNTEFESVDIKTEDYASVLLRFCNGAHGSMTVNQVAAGRKNRIYFEIYGDKMSVAWDSENPNEMWTGHRDRGNELLLKDPALMAGSSGRFAGYPGGHAEGFPDTSKQLFLEVYRYIWEMGSGSCTKASFPGFMDGVREALLCENILKSAREEKWVDIRE